MERNALQLWQKKHAKELKGERSKRVSALIMLLNLDLHSAKKTGSRYGCMVHNSICAAAAVDKSERWAESLRRWRRDWEESRIAPPGPKLARNQSWKSLYGDEGMILAVREYLNKQDSKANTTGLCLAMNEVLHARNAAQMLEGAAEGAAGMKITSISTRTAQRWFAQCGWIYSRNKKGYIDGHKREDVVQYREEVFIPRFRSILPTLREYDDDLEVIKPEAGGRRRVLVTHDESTFNANDGGTYAWKPKGTEWLRPKGRGQGLMVSDFLTSAQGRLAYTTPGGDRVLACEIIKYGKNHDGWWDSEKMIQQVKIPHIYSIHIVRITN